MLDVYNYGLTSIEGRPDISERGTTRRASAATAEFWERIWDVPHSDNEHVEGLKEILLLADSENARTLVKALGSRIAQISSVTQDAPGVRAALVAVRKTSIDLFEESIRRKEVEAAREAAFGALEVLEGELARWRELDGTEGRIAATEHVVGHETSSRGRKLPQSLKAVFRRSIQQGL